MTTERLQIQFLGLDEGADPKNLPPGTLLRAENLRMSKPRRLEKRYGTTGLVKTAVSGSNPAAGKRFLLNGSGTAITDGTTAWPYVTQLSKWNPIDRIPSWRATKRGLVDSSRSVRSVSIAIYQNLLITLYTASTASGGGLFYQVDDLNTGAPIVPSTTLINTALVAVAPLILISGTTAYMFASLAGAIQPWFMDLTTLVVTNNGALIADSTTAPTIFHACIGTPTAGVPTLYIAYELQSGANRLKIASFTVSTMAAISSLTPTGGAITLVSVAIIFGALAQRVTVIYSNSTTVKTELLTFTSAFGSAVGPTQLSASVSQHVFVVEDDATNVLLGLSSNSASGDGTSPDSMGTSLYSVAAHAVVATSARTTYGMRGQSMPWRVASRWYINAVTYVHPTAFPADASIVQPSTVVVEIETATSLTGNQDATHPHIATLENYTGWYVDVSKGQLQSAADADGNIWLASPYRNREPIGYTTAMGLPLGWDVFRLAAAEGDTFRSAKLGAASLCAGAAPVWFDGASTMPYGFAHAPQILSVTAANSGGVLAGSYSYVATYVWRDANGLIHRSAPSPPVTGTTATTNLTLNVIVSTSSLSGKQHSAIADYAADPVALELWRTTIGATGPHYRLTLEPTYQTLLNNPRTATVTLADTKPDSNIGSGTPAVTLASQAQLYTDLGELANIPPPSFITTTTHRARLVGIGPDLRTVWLSKDSTVDATIAPGFNEALTLAFSSDKTALATLDTVLVVFGDDDIDVVQGDGPSDTGDQNTWSIQAVHTDVGCVNPRSVVTAPLGVVFESRRGLELLDRSLVVAPWFGKGAIETLALFPTITSAVLVAEQHELRFTCDDGSNGIVLAYDYIEKIWFTRKYTDASDTAAASIRFVDAALINGVYTMLTAGGQVYRETTASVLDGGTTYVATDVLLAPISAQPGARGWSNDNLAWQRVKDLTVMGTSIALHDLKVSFALDYANTFGQTHTFLANSANSATVVGPLEKARVTLAVQKCQSVQIRLQDLTPTGSNVANTSAGPIFESLCLRVGAQRGPAKTSAGQQG